ncbi:hypothetical protein PVK06_048331 [Gossypium arboreum]|uniref:Uncharacterized protein n=1 Tax=Gossypium arboreum TaxID=29729 RepID=A0ABR0MHP2_GOSAR|nr:hypothetical protein PVK06_048331 [Gossypium arboreum]
MEFAGFRASYKLGNKMRTLNQVMNELLSYEFMLNGGRRLRHLRIPKTSNVSSAIENDTSDQNCKEYKDYRAKKGKGVKIFVIEVCLVEKSIDNWVIVSGVTTMCMFLYRGSLKREVCVIGASR